MRTCATCGSAFTGHGKQKYCRPICKPKQVYTPTSERYETYEREIVDAMTLIQMQRKKIDELKAYRKAYNIIKDYLDVTPDATASEVRNLCGL